MLPADSSGSRCAARSEDRPMPSAERTVTVDQPIEGVFDFIANGRNATTWRPGVLDIERVSGDGGQGTVFRQGVVGPRGRRVDADYEITAFERPTRLAFRAIAGPVRPEGEYELESLGGATVLTFSLRAELRGLNRFLMGGAVQRTMDAEMRALDGLKDLLER
jgi:uncharacterized protein YndB with AHSA1/START domain